MTKLWLVVLVHGHIVFREPADGYSLSACRARVHEVVTLLNMGGIPLTGKVECIKEKSK